METLLKLDSREVPGISGRGAEAGTNGRRIEWCHNSAFRTALKIPEAYEMDNRSWYLNHDYKVHFKGIFW